jgi:NADPH:quinone reductase-like Zn-dependent oxidoreductase
LADLIGRLVDSGKLKPVVETVPRLSEARRAHEPSEAGHIRGKIVLRIRSKSGSSQVAPNQGLNGAP